MEAMMRRISMIAFVGVVAFAVFATGCLDRKPAPVCPVPIEIASTRVTAGQFDGVDMLVVVDNSGSMAEEQQILSTGFFTLINSLTRPIDSEWDWPAVDNMRVAIVSSDMGLQYGDEGLTDGVEAVTSCENLVGDDGEFLPIRTERTTIDVQSGIIKCEDGGGQCPAEFNCNNGRCMSPGVGTVNCIAVNGGFAETQSVQVNDGLTTQVACLAMQGTDGCGVEQQLEASVRGLEKHPKFLVKTHLLAVLIVSDEEDCSVADKALYSTPEWLSGPGKELNIACNISETNESFLFDPQRYYSELVKMKNDAAASVIFAAIVGVPKNSSDSNQPICEGEGQNLLDCLTHEKMKLEKGTFQTPTGTDFVHFKPACTRLDEGTGDEITSARPGRRYVEVAKLFKDNAYVYSICNEDWGPAMERIAAIIARQMAATCYPKKLEWTKVSSAKRAELDCPNCGEARCDVVVEIDFDIKKNQKYECPDVYYEGLSTSEKNAYLARKEVQDVTSGGSVTAKKLYCPLPKIPAPKDCSEAGSFVKEKFKERVGWYYCETEGENFEDACQDNADNDGNGAIDCEDGGCKDCVICGGEGITCTADKCSYGVELTQKAKDETTGRFVNVQCLQQFRFEDQNCQEDSKNACNNKKDDDGNGVFDCDDTLDDPNASNPHQADSNCCPMNDPDKNKVCQPRISEIQRNCGKSVPWYQIDACIERIRELGCTVQTK
jgi:hypothetical protein